MTLLPHLLQPGHRATPIPFLSSLLGVLKKAEIQEVTDMVGIRLVQMEGHGCFWNVTQSSELSLGGLKALEVSVYTDKSGKADLQGSEEEERLCVGGSGDSLCLCFTVLRSLKSVSLI